MGDAVNRTSIEWTANWIKSYQDLGRHPKTSRLARTLGISRPAAIGHWHLLWWWALDYAKDGDLAARALKERTR